MAEQVVKELRISATETGFDRVIDRTRALQNANRSVTSSIEQLQTAMEQNGRRSGDSVRALQAYVERTQSSSRALREYTRDLQTINSAFSTGILSARAYATEFQRIRQALQDAGAPRGPQTDLQRNLDYIFSVRQSGGSARDSASVFEESDRAAAAYAKRLAEVRAQIDPLTAAQQRLTTELAEYQAMAARGDLSSADLAKATEMANDGFQIQAVRIGAVGEAAKLTGNQMLNLSRQANDVATMAAMGMPISMIVTSQLGQIYGALEENSRGVRGSIEAISNAVKGFFAGLGPVSIALSALSVAAVAFGLATRRNVEPIEDVIKGQADAVRDLREAYGLAGDAAAEYVRRSPQAVRVGVQSDNDAAVERARDEIFERRSFQFSGSDNRRYLYQPRFAEMRTAFADLIASVEQGSPRFAEFERALGKIAESDIDDHARDVIKANMEWARSLIPLQNELVGMERSLDAGAVAIERMGIAFGRSIDKLRDFVPAVSQARQIDIDFEEAAANARTMSEMLGAVNVRQQALAELARPAQESLRALQDELSTLDLSPLDRELARVSADYDRRFDERQRTMNDEAGLAALLAERDVALQIVRREHAIEAAEKSREEAEQYRKASAERLAGIQGTVEALEMERSLLGRSEGEIAAARFAYESLNEAKRAAATANSVVSAEEIAAIQQAASSIGILTDQLVAMREAQAQAERVAETIADLEFQGSLFGLSEADREIATTLNGLRLSYESLDGQRIAGAIRYNAAMEETQEQLEKQRQLVENVASTFLDIFTDSSSDSFFDRILSGLADVSRQFGELGKQRIMEGLLGSSALYTSGFPAPGQRTAAPIGVPAPSTGGVRLYAPANAQPSTATQAITEQLSTSVTKTVSDNLLRNMLGAGKDPSHIRGLNAEFASSLTQMFEAAPEAVRASVTINSGFRSVARQAELFEGALAKYGSEAAARKWVAPPGRSQHNFGRAVDLGYGNTASREWVHQNAARFGLRFPMAHENWHIEPMNARSGGGSATALRTAVRDGSLDATRALASGQFAAPSSVAIPSARPVASLGAGAPGSGLFGQGGRVQQFMQSPLGMGGMNALSAFGAGASSGSPVSGGFSGALGAFGMGLGPAGIIAGGLAGIVGGLFGRSRQRREQRRQQQEQERQQRLQAQQQLDQQLPAILELQDTLLDRASGTLTKERARIESQIKQYQQLAATAKNQAEIDRLKSMQANLDDYMGRLYDQIRLTADSVVQSMMAGRGLEPEFAKAVSAVREQSLSIRNYLADLTAATGEGSSAVVQATEAGRTQLLRQLSGAEEVTEIWTGLDRLSGTAAQLGTELQKLGMNAEEAAAAVRDHLNRGIQRMRDDFVRGIADETAEGMGLGYLPQLRALTDRRNTMRADATSLGADPALIDRWFGVQARNILDQAGLLNDEIAPLVKAFPELAGILGDSSAKIERTLGDAENDLRTAYQRVRQFADQLASFRGDIALDRNLSVLGPQERLVEAQNRFREASEKAAAGDAVAQGELIGLSRSYLDEARSYYASSEGYFSIFREVDGTLKATEAKVVAELDMATAQHKALLDLNESVLTIPDALRQLNDAMAARDLAQGQALQAYVQALNPQTAVPTYQQPNVTVTPTAPVGTAPPPAPTAPAMVNRSLWNGQTFSNYVGNFEEFNGRSIFVPSGWTPARAWGLHVQQQQAPQTIGGLARNEKRFGGLIGYGMNGLNAFQNGGIVGNGIWDQDSVTARHLHGGEVWLAGGEGILTAPAMQRPGVRSFMEAANANRLPSIPQVALPSMPRPVAADNHEVVAELRAVREELQSLKAIVGDGALGTIAAVKEGHAPARALAREARRQRAA